MLRAVHFSYLLAPLVCADESQTPPLRPRHLTVAGINLVSLAFSAETHCTILQYLSSPNARWFSTSYMALVWNLGGSKGRPPSSGLVSYSSDGYHLGKYLKRRGIRCTELRRLN